MGPVQTLATPKEVAKHLGITPNRLSKMRMVNEGPECVRLGPRTIRYEWSAVQEWIAGQGH